jgi:hypothetical protein
MFSGSISTFTLNAPLVRGVFQFRGPSAWQHRLAAHSLARLDGKSKRGAIKRTADSSNNAFSCFVIRLRH